MIENVRDGCLNVDGPLVGHGKAVRCAKWETKWEMRRQ